jgi:hypothetical protein
LKTLFGLCIKLDVKKKFYFAIFHKNLLLTHYSHFHKKHNMNKIVTTLMFSFILTLSFSQSKNTSNHGDSLFFQGTWYSPADYKVAVKEDEYDYFETWLMPGLGFTYYQPSLSDSTGIFSGLTVEYLIYGKISHNDNTGPSQVRVYTKLNILKSNKANINSLFMYTLGVDLSLEKNPSRQYLVPFFGLELGGMSQNQFGSTIQFTPTFGVHLLSKKNIFINVHGGYVYPLKNFETLQGWFGQVGVNFALW